MITYLADKFNKSHYNQTSTLVLPKSLSCIDDLFHYEYVYVIYSPITQLYKIGISKDVKKRLTDIQNIGGLPVIPILCCELEIGSDASNYGMEKFLHNEYKNKRVIGEWFSLTKRDLVYIRTLFVCEGENVDTHLLKDYIPNNKYLLTNPVWKY